MAHFSKDPVLVEAFRNGEDIHARTAQEVFGVGPMAQNAEHRPRGKPSTSESFTAFAFGPHNNWHRAERGGEIHQCLFHALSRRQEYLDNILAETRKTGVAKTLLKNSPIPEINSPQMQLRNFAERTALNSPCRHGGGFDQAGDDQYRPAPDEREARCQNDPAGPRRTALRGSHKGERQAGKAS